MERTIITKAERLRNIELIEKCKAGLYFMHINRNYKTEWGESAGYGYGTLVFNGVEVELNGNTGKTLTQLNEDKWSFDIENDGKHIPAAFMPKNLFEHALFNHWKNTQGGIK